MKIENLKKVSKNEILVESLNNSWRGEKWLGWFELRKDVDIVGEKS